MNTWLPTVIAVLSAGSSLVYMIDGDWRKFTYWFAATVMTLVLTY